MCSLQFNFADSNLNPKMSGVYSWNPSHYLFYFFLCRYLSLVCKAHYFSLLSLTSDPLWLSILWAGRLFVFYHYFLFRNILILYSFADIILLIEFVSCISQFLLIFLFYSSVYIHLFSFDWKTFVRLKSFIITGGSHFPGLESFLFQNHLEMLMPEPGFFLTFESISRLSYGGVN